MMEIHGCLGRIGHGIKVQLIHNLNISNCCFSPSCVMHQSCQFARSTFAWVFINKVKFVTLILKVVFQSS